MSKAKDILNKYNEGSIKMNPPKKPSLPKQNDIDAVDTVIPNDLKKGTWLITKQLGKWTLSELWDSKRGNIRLIYTHGEDIGMFSEHGSIYVKDMVAAFVDGKWKAVVR